MSTLTKPIDVVLRAIREEREFRKDFSTIADSIVDKVYSYYTNPNCQCKSNIIDWVNNNVDATNTLLQKYDTSIIAMTGEIAKANEIAKLNAPKAPNAPGTPPSNHMATMVNNPKAKFGAVINISKETSAYTSLIKQAMSEGWIYRGCTVTPNVVDGQEVWSVFFY